MTEPTEETIPVDIEPARRQACEQLTVYLMSKGYGTFVEMDNGKRRCFSRRIDRRHEFLKAQAYRMTPGAIHRPR